MSKCVGCGIELQNIDKCKDGYVDNLEYGLCYRCFLIKNYGQNKDISTGNVDYLKILDNIKDDDLVVYVTSLLTLNMDYVNKFKKVLLALTKRDVLPKSIKDNKIINYIKDRYDNIEDIIIVSAYKKFNLDVLYNKLNKYNNKNIYFVGITNSGKSSLINEMIKSYNGYDGDITTSNFPSTTLGLVSKTIGSLNIKDTPGIVITDSIINYLDTKNIKKINSKKEIKPITFQIKGHGAILIDELIRIEYDTDVSSMTFYMANSLNIKSISLNNPRLKDLKEVFYNVDNDKDIVIEDIGFIKCTNRMKVKIIYKDELHVSLRDNLI